jgi:OMF family outer membrane factor
MSHLLKRVKRLTIAAGSLYFFCQPCSILAQRERSTLKLPNGSEVIIPDPPPTFTPEARDVSPAPSPGAEALQIPQDPLQVRIEQTQELSLEEALALGVAQNPEIQEAELDVRAAEANQRQVRAAYAPTLRSSASYSLTQLSRVNPPPVDGDLSATLFDLTYTLLDPGRDWDTQIADIDLRIRQLTLAQLIQRVKLQVAESYYNLQRAEADVIIRQSAVDQQETNLQETIDREEVGLGTRFDVLSARANLADRQTQLIRAQNERRTQQRALAERLNFAIPTDVLATQPLDPQGRWDLTLEESIIAALSAREELELQRQNRLRAEAQAQRAEAILKPRVRLSANISTSDVTELQEGLGLGYSAAASVDYTWFDGGSSAAQAEIANISAEATAKQFEQDRNAIRQEVEEAFFLLNSNLNQIKASKTSVEDAQEAFELARLRFNAGIGTQREVLDAEDDLTTARATLANAIIEYNRSLARLKRSTNQL